MRTTHDIEGRRKLGKTLAYYFTPTQRQLRKMLIVAGLGMVFLMGVVAWRADVFVVAYHVVMGRPLIVSYEAWDVVPCPQGSNPNRICTKSANPAQPALLPTPAP
jgi:hypothetical protein